ncbi:MAG: glycogen synthase GlgA [Pseudomonadota bacterium]
MKILSIASEASGFAKTGGLADVAGVLPLVLASLGHEVSLILPYYKQIKLKHLDAKKVSEKRYSLTIGKEEYSYMLLKYHYKNINVFFIEQDDLFNRVNLYGDGEKSYDDNIIRFAFFNRVSVNLLEANIISPDIVHLHDWQTGLIPLLLKINKNKKLSNLPTLFTIHNLAYQGLFVKENYNFLNLPWSFFNIEGLEFFDQINFLKAGLVYSTLINTVSEKYCKEIQTKEFGAGLDGIVQKRKNDLHGILNGADYLEWNPEVDDYIKINYSIEDFQKKQICKKDLLDCFNIDKKYHDYPVFGFVGRLAKQKGVELIIDVLPDLLKKKTIFIMLGIGNKTYEDSLHEISEKHKDRMGLAVDFSNSLAHKIIAGSDFFLMPSEYEPCGLSQIYALKYGTLPIVRATGGLDDTIKECDFNTLQGTGFKFELMTKDSFNDSLSKAISLYNDKTKLLQIIKNAMNENFSWEKSALKYIELYEMSKAKVRV